MILERVIANRGIECKGNRVGHYRNLTHTATGRVEHSSEHNCTTHIYKGKPAFRLSLDTSDRSAIWLCDDCARTLAYFISSYAKPKPIETADTPNLYDMD